MKLPKTGKLVRIFIGEGDHLSGKPLHEKIVEEARKRGLAGATVLRGTMGFGANSRIHTTKVLRLSEDLPIIIEIVDEENKVEKFLPWLDEVVNDGLVTIEKVEVFKYQSK